MRSITRGKRRNIILSIRFRLTGNDNVITVINDKTYLTLEIVF